ncbi:tetratricopeptide repeat protein [Actinoplanes sp. TBRC 11911]|uniref:tetratricopeptide repeat protein n=1 Tax=Actinoplanes sp. TBRC 11911 TaxID=2729386 RepID=UPI00145E89E3|nr:tetratricopeptide repeat protein [Actinoplanes sp. TBRC 11911]NMO55673.1 tetratricopeptide repeat protein [Actinoplanes sp. TBRC 11911]
MSDAVSPPHRVVSNLPSRDTGFVGRQAELTRVRTALRASGRTVIAGPSGIGRTSLSLEYAHRSADEYDGIWWLTASRAELVGGQLAQAAYAAGLADPDVTDPAALEALANAIAGGARWLLILDDVVAEPWLPPGAHVILTVAALGTLETRAERETEVASVLPRRPETPMAPGLPHPPETSAAPGPPHQPETDASSDDAVAPRWFDSALDFGESPLGPLRPEDTASLLRQRVPGPPPELAELGDMPFAVSQAAALLSLGDVPDTALTSPTTGTGIAIDRLDRDHPAAAQLLCLCAVLASSPVPVDLFTRSLNLLPGPLGGVSPQDFYSLIDTLTSYGLVATGVDGLRTHPLVQEAVRVRLGAAEDICRSYAGSLVTAALPPDSDDPSSWSRWVALAPHVLATGSRPAAYRLVLCLLRRASPHAARTMAADLHASWLAALGLDHPDTRRMAVALARAHQALGEPQAALILTAPAELDASRRPAALDDALALSARQERLRRLDTHASAVTALGDAVRGHDLHRAALAGCLDVLGSDHPDTLRAGRGLARCRYQLGSHGAAGDLLSDIVDRSRRVLGPDHPDTLSAASDLAVTLTASGVHTEALALCSDTLTRRRRVLGSAHPHTLASWHSLATIRYAMGSRTEARRLYQDVLSRRTDLLGPDNPDTLRTAHSLSIALLAGGAVLPARLLLDDTLDRLTHTLGTAHPLTADVRETRERALVRMGGMPRRPRRPAPRRGRR